MSAPQPVGPARAKPALIKDVAALARVSLKTVTNVVHDRPHVKQETRQRVQAAIDELGYRPSLAGRRLQSGRSNTITLAVPRIDEPYLGTLAHAIIAAAGQRGYTVLIDETGSGTEHEELAAAGYPGHGIDGVIYSPAALNPQHLAAMSHDTPMVLLGEHLPDSTADHVAIDNVASAREVVRHLLAGGRQRIAFLGNQPDRTAGVGELRNQGYRLEMAEAGLQVMEGWTAPASRFTREEGETRGDDFVRTNTSLDALVCASDLLAIGAMRSFRRHGITVPGDIAVVGWDNTIDAAYHSPSLTSIAPDLQRLAALTLDALVSRIDGNRDVGQSYVVPHELIVRDSTRADRG